MQKKLYETMKQILDDTSSTTAPGGGLTQNKDGTFTYTPKT